MGRLFWKIFLGFWLTLVLMTAAVGLLFYIHNQQRLTELNDLAAGPWAGRNIVSVSTAMQYGGVVALRQLARQWPGRRRLPVMVVGDDGRDALQRIVPEGALRRARVALDQGAAAANVARVTTPDGQRYLLFVPARLPHLGGGRRHARFGPDPFYVRLGIALFASVLFSAALAWYLTRPLRHLSRAAQSLAEGRLDARVMPRLGRRRDEIADLGRDFDHMAGRLQALIGAQQRLLNDVSHELRSPLARLQVAVALARQQPDKLALALERIEREGGRLDALVGQLLTLSRLEAGVVQGTDEYLELNSLLESVVEDARFEAEAVHKQVDLHAGGDLVVRGRADLLLRAFDNVIRNAVRYTASGSAVEVRVEHVDSPSRALVSVCDCGPGVAEARLADLFEPFVRAREDEGEGMRGYGLGLAITRRAIEAHGGLVDARNRAEGGLCVQIWLPLASEFPLPLS